MSRGRQSAASFLTNSIETESLESDEEDQDSGSDLSKSLKNLENIGQQELEMIWRYMNPAKVHVTKFLDKRQAKIAIKTIKMRREPKEAPKAEPV
jgi:hypothetical protein